MAIRHDGTEIPEAGVLWDPNQIEWVSFGWDAQVALRGAITASEWVLPDGWTIQSEDMDVPVQALDGTEQDHGNRARIKFEGSARTAIITNRVTFSNSTQLDRSVLVVIQDT